MNPDNLPKSEAERPRSWPRYSQEQLSFIEDELGRRHYRTPEGRRVCGRLRNRKNRVISNEACQAPPMPSGACRIHGGASPGAPLTAGGRYSRVLTKWKGRFEAALADKGLLDVRPDIALMDTLVSDLAKRAEDLDTPGWRQELLAAFEELSKAIRGGRGKAIGPALKALEDLIRRGADADRVAAELSTVVDRRAERATKTLALRAKTDERITTRELMLLLGNLIETLKERLEPETFRVLLPHLRELSAAHELPFPGSADEADAEMLAAESLVELDEGDEGDEDDDAAA